MNLTLNQHCNTIYSITFYYQYHLHLPHHIFCELQLIMSNDQNSQQGRFYGCFQLAEVYMPLIMAYYNTILHLHSKLLLKSLAALHNMLKFSAFSYIWLPLVLCPTCSSLA